MKAVRALDPSTSLRYTRAGKSGASGVRYDRYRHAGTVAEYLRLHPGRGKAHPDLLYDLTHGNVVAERHGVSVFHALPAQPSAEPGCDAPLTAAALHSLLLESATASHREQEARDRALAERLSAWPHGGVEALAWEAILRREDVEARAAGPIGPALAGEPGHLDTVIRECLGEGAGSATALEGAGMGDPDWTSPLAAPVVESYYAYSAEEPDLSARREAFQDAVSGGIPSPPMLSEQADRWAATGFAKGFAAAVADSSHTTRSPAAAGAQEPLPIKSVAQAKRDPQWGSEGSEGFRDAFAKEIKRVFVDFKAIRYVTADRRREAIRIHGFDKVHTKSLVTPFKVKTDAEGNPTVHKARITVADLVSQGRLADTYAACVMSQSVRFLAQLIAQYPDATFGTSDIGGAYYHGTPTPPDERGGRVLFARVPPGWEEFGYPQRRSDGTVMYFEIVGNLPGRQDAGRVWGDCYTSFMRDTCKFEQSIVDRRIFFRLGHGPTTRSGRRPILMVVGIHVDDNLIVSKDATASAEFNALWEAKFDSAPDSQLTQNDYLGIRLTRPSAGLMELQAPGLLQKLDAMIGAVFESRPPGTPAARPRGDVPINPDIFHQVAIGVSDANPVLGPETQTPARRVLGLAGFIVSQCRPDGYFAFVVLSQYIAHRFTKHVWRGILKLGCYLVETASIKLTYRAVTLRPATEDGDPDGTLPWAGFTDSSSQNGDRGGSYGGGCLAAETGPDESPSGIFMWLCMVPRRMTDSTMGAELTMAWAILKAIVSHRILSLELGILPAGPTRLHIDAQAVLDGADMEQVSRASRYLATRLAGYRDSVNAGVLLPCKTPGADNVSDLFTKALIGKTFYRLRDLALGLRSLEDSDSDHGNKSYPTDTAVAPATGPSANPSRAEGALEPVA